MSTQIAQRSIEVKCPVCMVQKTINLPMYLFEKKQVGLLKVQIHKGICCEHPFVVFMDRKGAIKGYEQVDLQIDLTDFAQRKMGNKIYLRDLLKLYADYAVANMLHAILTKYNIIILYTSQGKNLGAEVNNLLNEYLPDGFKVPIIVKYIEENELKKTKVEDHLIISPNGIVAQTPWQDTTYNFENSLMRKALDILDDESQAIIVQQEIETLFDRVKFVKDTIKDKPQIYEDDLKEILKKQFNLGSVTDYDIILIKRILKSQFKTDVSKIKIRSFDKLKEGLW